MLLHVHFCKKISVIFSTIRVNVGYPTPCFWPVSKLVCYSQSVYQSVSPFFLVSATSLKLFRWISLNFVGIWGTTCRRAYYQKIPVLLFIGISPLWAYRSNFVVVKEKYKCAYLQEVLMLFFFSEVMFV